MEQVKSDDLTAMWTEGCCLLAWASYEDRCLGAARRLRERGPISGFIVHFDERDYDIKSNLRAMRSLFGASLVEEINLDRSAPFAAYSILVSVISKLLTYSSPIVDISCFPRDVLLLLQLIVHRGDAGGRIKLSYNLASNYSLNEPDEAKWLSKGLVETKPILGFRGRMVPGLPLCVIGLLGLDRDRFLQIVASLQPDELIIGIGGTSDEKREWLYERNRSLAAELSAATSVRETFTFDCDSIAGTIAQCVDQIDRTKEFNICMVVMNNKLSTLAVGALALVDRRIQIVHGGAIIYNMSGYSQGSDLFFVGAAQGIYDNARDIMNARREHGDSKRDVVQTVP